MPTALDVQLIVDNYCTRKAKAIRALFALRPRCHLHFTLTHSSVLNQVECCCAVLAERQIRRIVHCSARQREDAVARFIEVHSAGPEPFVLDQFGRPDPELPCKFLPKNNDDPSQA